MQNLNLPLPCKLTLINARDFVLEAAKSSKNEGHMAARIAAAGEVTVTAKYNLFGETLYDTNIPWSVSGTIGIRQSELKYFSIQAA